MKYWQPLLLGILLGFLFSAALFLVISPSRGKAIGLSLPPTPAPLVIYITGAVNHPGMYPLARSSRVSDAIEAAGGLLASADQTAINLAARLVDGQKIVIPDILQPVSANGVETPQAKQNETNSSGITPSQENPLNLNTASQEDFDQLPGIGPTRAADIVAYRTQHGAFKTADEIMDVPGIGQGTFDQIKNLIYVDESN